MGTSRRYAQDLHQARILAERLQHDMILLLARQLLNRYKRDSWRYPDMPFEEWLLEKRTLSATYSLGSFSYKDRAHRSRAIIDHALRIPVIFPARKATQPLNPREMRPLQWLTDGLTAKLGGNVEVRLGWEDHLRLERTLVFTSKG